jgi:hypothetical protein
MVSSALFGRAEFGTTATVSPDPLFTDMRNEGTQQVGSGGLEAGWGMAPWPGI